MKVKKGSEKGGKQRRGAFDKKLCLLAFPMGFPITEPSTDDDNDGKMKMMMMMMVVMTE